ncbi:MAG: polysaccharide biosynthesis protein, partial [Actinomycetota bacterium]
VTITHPDMTRFLMTIPEASQLVVQATGLADNGAVYVLDMGEPVKMLDLARDMIQLLGFRVGDDIDIEYTGVRPGEKMHEALFCDWERPVATTHEKILMARDEDGSHGASMPQIEALVDAARARDREGMFALLRRLTPSYVPWGREDAPVGPPAPEEGAV